MEKKDKTPALCGTPEKKPLSTKEADHPRFLRERLQLLLALPVADREQKQMLRQAGIPARCCDNLQLVVWNLYQKALSGDLTAIRTLRDMLEEETVRSKGEKNGEPAHLPVVIIDDLR